MSKYVDLLQTCRSWWSSPMPSMSGSIPEFEMMSRWESCPQVKVEGPVPNPREGNVNPSIVMKIRPRLRVNLDLSRRSPREKCPMEASGSSRSLMG